MAAGIEMRPDDLEVYRRMRDAQLAAIEQMRAGTRVCDVYAACGRAFERAGLPFQTPHVGHGLGIGLHEYPIIHPLNTDELKPGMLINIEPGLVLPGRTN